MCAENKSEVLRHDQRGGENDSFFVEFVHKSRMLTVAVFGSAAFASWDWCCRLISTSVNGTGWISAGWVTHFSALQVYVSVMHCTPHRTRPLSRFPHMSAINVTSQRASGTSLKIICCISFTGYCSSVTIPALMKELCLDCWMNLKWRNNVKSWLIDQPNVILLVVPPLPSTLCCI